ncbi:zinc finger CCCH domain-containing protein 27-like isoform X2 [Telopea speciosissima]|uniref:zinc finger CCCH domain-containing protein 27-like isoform X2 n=1 Tax=Telopea speciosissima TaxID=54955 RepID=UPI001CC474DC|nr:zinc finger CCCH domain-containing protein 27-like isoform X2 [Telopea speciosissima]
MVGDMKFGESSLTGYLVKNLEPLTEADPVILAEYVVALLKKDKPIEELQKLCAENLVDFLGQDTKPFITKLFQALDDGSIVAPAESLDAIRKVEPPPSFIAEDPAELTISSPKPDGLSPISDPEEKEVSDDEDDDRNHKHRRRESRSQSFDKDAQEEFLSRPYRKRNKPYENGQLYLESDPQPSETRKEYNLSHSERDFSAKFEKRRPGMAIQPFAPLDLGQRTIVNQAFRGDPGARFDLSTSLGSPPFGRGRGRSFGPWSQHDSRFSSVDMLDFALQMAPQGATPPSLFPGRGLSNAGNAQSGSWSAFGLIPGMPNGSLDTFHPLGLQGTLKPPINPSLSIGMSRQRCKDFEERGFCLRGDMCPMEHGVNRIVVEDVQSLSQFNLPVSLPSARLLGVPSGTGPLTSVSAPSGLLTTGKGLHGKSTKPGTNDDGIGLNGVLASSAGLGEADLYDPDQPLWNTDRQETSSALLRLPSPKTNDVESLWETDTSYRHSLRVSDGIDSERPGKSITTTAGSQSSASSVWGRIGTSGTKIETTGTNDNALPSLGSLGDEAKEDLEEALPSFSGTAHRGKPTFMGDIDPKSMNSSATPKRRNDHGRNGGRSLQKALRTLFVNGIPQKGNKRETLLTHFQKFGEVIDIYIPLNSERAFVQFSKREEAEAALKAPDAVMGNRFIKLWWANRDSIPDDGINSGNTVSAVPYGVTTASVPSQSSITDGAKENTPSAPPKVSITASNVPVPAAVHPKPVAVNGPKAIPPVQKKIENLELLKEELRKKQEMLDQKRNVFRRQLDKLEKQAITVKGEAASDQAIKRHKVGTAIDIAKAASPRPTDLGTTGERPGAENTVDKNMGENGVSPSSKTSSPLMLQSPKNSKQLSRPSAPIGPPFLVNRFKLDNRPTAFKILSPLPAEFVNVIELDDSDSCTRSAGLGPSTNCSARITFTTRRAAERAFLNGKCWHGHSLQFAWLATSNNFTSEPGGRENSPIPTPRAPPEAELPTRTSVSGLSSSSTGKSTSIGSQDVTAAGDGDSRNSEGIKSGAECIEVVEGCQSSSSPVSSSETHSPKSDTLIVEEGTHVSSVHIEPFNAQGSNSVIEGP